MRKNLYKAITIVAILGSFAMLLMLQNAIAFRSAKQPHTAFQTVILGKAQRVPVYVMTDLTKTANVTIAVEAASHGTVAEMVSRVYPGRTATKIPWKSIDKQGYLLPGVYNISITAKEFYTEQPISIWKYGVAFGYSNSRDAENAVDITAVEPDPVEKAAKIKYTLGLEAAVTMDIINDKGDKIDTIIAGQRRIQGHNEEKWVRSKKAKSGDYIVNVTAKDINNRIALDFQDFKCK